MAIGAASTPVPTAILTCTLTPQGICERNWTGVKLESSNSKHRFCIHADLIIRVGVIVGADRNRQWG